MTALVWVPPSKIGEVWSYILPWVASATADTGDWWQPEDVRGNIEAGRMTLWIISDGIDPLGIVATEFEQAAQHKICVVALCAGREQSRWLHLLTEIENWALDAGCSEIQVRGRAGWVRRLKSLGFTERYIAIGKPLTQSTQRPEIASETAVST